MTKTKKKKEYFYRDEQEESEITSDRSDKNALIALLRFLLPEKKSYFKGLAFILLSSSCVVLSAHLIGPFVEQGLKQSDVAVSIKYASMIVGLEFLFLLFLWFGRNIISEASSDTILGIRKKLFDHLQNLPLWFYDHQPQGRIITRVTHDVEGLDNFFANSLGRVATAIVMAIIATIGMLIADIKIGLILAALMLPTIIFLFATRQKVQKLNRRMSRLSSAINSRLSEFLNGIEVIRLFGLENWTQGIFGQDVDRHLDSQLSANNYFGLTRPLISFLCSFPLIGLVWFGGLETLRGTMSIGVFVTFIRLCERFVHPILTLAREIHVIQQALTSADRVQVFLDQEQESSRLGENGVLGLDEMNGEIEFDRVEMKYEEGGKVLDELSFKIRSGEKIGLVGRTGSGKTTMVSLLSRLYPYQGGQIFIDGEAIERYDRDKLREKIGFVSQDVVIFQGSLRENLTTDESLSDDIITGVANSTGLGELMRVNNLSLDYHIIDGGENLSAGERQLIGLTRVLLRNPSLLILDEATSNIDQKLENVIQSTVYDVMKNKTCIFVAHRLATLEKCDRIFVFDSGRLVEQGSKEELLARGGHFTRLQNLS